MATKGKARPTKRARKSTSRTGALSPYVRGRVAELERAGELPGGSTENLEKTEREKKS